MTDTPMLKEFKGILIVNWKNKKMRVTKRKPNNLSPYEIPINVDIKIEVPQSPVINVTGKVIIPQYKADQIMLETL